MIKKILFILLSALVFVSCSAKIISPSGNSSIESEGNDQSGGGTLPTEEELIAKYAIDIGLEDTEISQKIEENLKAYYEEMGTYRVIFTGIPKDYMGGAESLSSLVYEAAKKAAADKVDVDIRNIDFKDGAIESYMFAEGLDSQAPFVLNFIFPENTITTIKTLAFNMLSSLKEITIPSSVTMIEDSAFSYCSQLEKLVFEEGITTIWASSFPQAEKLKELVLPSTLIYIEDMALVNTGLTELTIPNSVISIGIGAFASSINLTKITIPASVTSISDMAFYASPELTTVIYLGKTPNNITSAGSRIFEGCTKLTTLIIPNADNPDDNAWKTFLGGTFTTVIKQ